MQKFSKRSLHNNHFFNCALRLSELASLNVNQVDNDILSVVGKGNKERKIFLTPASKKAINDWLHIRNLTNVATDALFISTHNLRHPAATLMYKYGRVDIRSLQHPWSLAKQIVNNLLTCPGSL